MARLFLSLASLVLLGLLAAASPPGDGGDDRAARLLEGYEPEELGAPLALRTACVTDPALARAAGRLRCVLQVVVELEGASPRSLEALRTARLTLRVDRRDEEPLAFARSLSPGALAGAPAWVILAPLDLPEETRALAVVVVGAVEKDVWGGGLASLTSEPLEAPEASALTEIPDLAGPPPSSALEPGAEATSAVRLIPPKAARVEGSTRFEVLVSTGAVSRVAFFLDGEPADEDGRAPFAARLDLGSPPREHTVRAVAYDEAGGVLGEDELVLNRDETPFRVSLAVEGDPARGFVDARAAVSVPAGAVLDRVEIYLNEELVGASRKSPFSAQVPTADTGPADFVRAVAHLAGGASTDTAQLLAARGVVERVDVNLSELFVVVTDADGSPVAGLGREDFEILAGGRPHPVESFSYADDVPLLLGLVIDSSGSMEGIMNETKQAAGGFLAEVIGGRDRAFVVDFDTRPRLAQAATGELRDLFASFAQMTPDGFTATYDSILFSLIQFGSGRGRKALVVLTDGDDYRSRISPRRVIDDARKAGVPVYVIGLGAEDRMKRVFHGNDLNDVAAKTGGRVYLVSDPQQLAGAYAEIHRELRSQYFLAFYPQAGLSAEARRDVEVRVRRAGLRARTVVGAE